MFVLAERDRSRFLKIKNIKRIYMDVLKTIHKKISNQRGQVIAGVEFTMQLPCLVACQF